MKQLTNEAFSPEESKKIYDNFLSIVGTRRDKLVKRYGSEAEKVAYAKAVKQVKKQAEEKPMEKEIEEGTCGYGVDGEIGDTPAGPMLIRLKEMVKDALKNPKKADLNKDGKLSDYEKKRGAAIEKSMQKEDLDIKEDMDLPIRDNVMDFSSQLLNQINSYKDSVGPGEKMIDYTKTMAAIQNLMKAIDMDEKEDMSYGDAFRANLKKRRKKEEEEKRKLGFLEEDLDVGHTDDEPGMLKADLYRIGKYSMELYKMVDKFDEMDSEVDFPHWWQSKITKSKGMLVSAKHYLDFEMKEPQIDAMVDVASEEGVIDEGYDDGEMGTYQSSDTRHYKNPQDMETYLSAIKGMTKVEAIEHLGEEGLSSSMVMRVLNKADRMGMFDVQDMFDVNPRVRGDVFELKIDEKLKPSMGAGAYVDDFKDSKSPQFKGKSKKKKQEMAVAAYLSAKDKKKVAEAVVKKLSENPATVKAVEKLQPILFDILKATEKVDKSQDDTEADVEELDKSIDYLSAALTGDNALKVSADQSAYGRLASPNKKIAETIFNKLRS